VCYRNDVGVFLCVLVWLVLLVIVIISVLLFEVSSANTAVIERCLALTKVRRMWFVRRPLCGGRGGRACWQEQHPLFVAFVTESIVYSNMAASSSVAGAEEENYDHLYKVPFISETAMQSCVTFNIIRRLRACIIVYYEGKLWATPCTQKRIKKIFFEHGSWPVRPTVVLVWWGVPQCGIHWKSLRILVCSRP